MAIGANSYATVVEVEAFTPQYLIGGSFTTVSRPTLAQVEKFIDRISAILNTLLAAHGFDIPVTQADAKLVLDHFVAEECADLVEAVNKAGRFYLGEKELRGRGRFRVIMSDAMEFIEEYAQGLEDLGATRDRSQSSGLGYWDTDDGGGDMEPLFQTRGWMRQDAIDWDTG